MAPDPFISFAMMPHVVEKLLSHLSNRDILCLATISPTVANFCKTNTKLKVIWSAKLLRRNKPSSFDPVCWHETETSVRIVNEDGKMASLLELLSDLAPDPWFKDSPEVAGVFVKDVVQAQKLTKYLTEKGISAEILNGPPSSGTIRRINKLAWSRLHVMIIYRYEGNFEKLYYFSRLVAMEVPDSINDLKRLLNFPALRLNILVTKVFATSTRAVIEYLIGKSQRQEDGSRPTVIHQGNLTHQL